MRRYLVGISFSCRTVYWIDEGKFRLVCRVNHTVLPPFRRKRAFVRLLSALGMASREQEGTRYRFNDYGKTKGDIHSEENECQCGDEEDEGEVEGEAGAHHGIEGDVAGAEDDGVWRGADGEHEGT